MTSHTPIQRSGAHRLAQATFKVWRVSSCLAHPHPVAGETLLDVERELATAANHGETFFVAETLTIDGGTTLHTVLIRRGKAIGWDANARRTYSYSADRLCSVGVKAFEPREPWRWTPGCDAVGFSDVIEGRAA